MLKLKEPLDNIYFRILKKTCAILILSLSDASTISNLFLFTEWGGKKVAPVKVPPA